MTAQQRQVFDPASASMAGVMIAAVIFGALAYMPGIATQAAVTVHRSADLPYPVRLARYGIRAPKTYVPGREVAGRVEAAGQAVTTLHVGDKVFGIADGSFAEYASESWRDG